MSAQLATDAVVEEINALHHEIVGAARTTLQKACRCGELLTAQKAKLNHGSWLPWIEANLPFDRTTAMRYMRVFERRDKCCTLQHLTEAYRILAAPPKAPARRQPPSDYALHDANSDEVEEPAAPPVPEPTVAEEEPEPVTAMQHAELAIEQLARIDPKDSSRAAAFNLVKDWIATESKRFYGATDDFDSNLARFVRKAVKEVA